MHRHDYVSAYVDDLPAVDRPRRDPRRGLRLGVDPLGGASVAYWPAIAERHGLDLEIVNDELDPTFRFVPLDWDGKIRMDCSSPYAMARLRDLPTTSTSPSPTTPTPTATASSCRAPGC